MSPEPPPDRDAIILSTPAPTGMPDVRDVGFASDPPAWPDGAAVLDRRSFLRVAALVGAAVAIEACANVVPPPMPSLPVTSGSPPVVPSNSPPTSRPGPSPSEPASPAGRSGNAPVAVENRLAGSRRWDDTRHAIGSEAYLGVSSVVPGGRLRLRASGSGVVDVEWYRLGWYGGAGGRLLRTDRRVRLARQAPATTDPHTGLTEAAWPAILEAEAPTGCPSGMLLAVLRTPGGVVVANAPVVLRPDPATSRRAPVLFVSAAGTWQAYNDWGGLSLYVDARGGSVPATKAPRSAVVSFDRPYQEDGGAGQLRRWELQFIRWMEREGRDVEYMADVDLELNPALLAGRRLMVMAGHPEYWSRPMRSAVEQAVAAGTNVAFLTGNEVFWQVRLETNLTGLLRIVCYKSAPLDPMTVKDPGLATCQWRQSPLNAPEAALVGEMYGAVAGRSADWVVTEPGHWLYEGTRLAAGDHLVNLVGQEYDTFYPDLAPAGTLVLARGPVNAVTGSPRTSIPGPHFHTATTYVAGSGATVVAAGTFQWSWAIERYGVRRYLGVATPYDPRVVRMTQNLFDRLGDGPLAP